MSDFFPIPEREWYLKRDDRTDRIEGVAGFELFSVGVIIPENTAANPSVQAMAIISLNLLSRWCRKITVQLHDDVMCKVAPYEGVSLKGMLLENMHKVDPYGCFNLGDANEEECDALLVIGESDYDIGSKFVWINSSGWIGGFGSGISQNAFSLEQGSFNPVGPAFASCLGVAELFRRAIGIERADHFSIWYSLFSLNQTTNHPEHLENPAISDKLNLGRVYQLGCGAVGSSLDMLMRMVNFQGEFYLMDDDVIDVSNCNRSLPFDALDGVNRTPKVQKCREVLESRGTRVKEFRMKYGTFIGSGAYLKESPDIILCLANEENVWSTIQQNFPPLVLHATTTMGWGTNFGRHIPKKDWCILCRFSSELNPLFVPKCGVGEIHSSATGSLRIQGVLPFLPVASATIMLSELVKLASHYGGPSNFITFSFKGKLGRFLKQMISPSEDCICKEQNEESYPQAIMKSKFWVQ